MLARLLRRGLPIGALAALVACTGDVSPELTPPDAGYDGVAGAAGSPGAGGQDGGAGSNVMAESGTDAISRADGEVGPDATVDTHADSEVGSDATVDATDGPPDAGEPDVGADAPSTDASDGGSGDGSPGGMVLHGTIGTTAPLPSAVGTVRLVRQGLSVPGAMFCNGTMCLRSGGVFP